MPSDLKTESDYTAAIGEGNLSVVHFTADWAAECATVTAVLQELEKDNSLRNIFKIIFVVNL